MAMLPRWQSNLAAKLFLQASVHRLLNWKVISNKIEGNSSHYDREIVGLDDRECLTKPIQRIPAGSRPVCALENGQANTVAHHGRQFARPERCSRQPISRSRWKLDSYHAYFRQRRLLCISGNQALNHFN